MAEAGAARSREAGQINPAFQFHVLNDVGKQKAAKLGEQYTCFLAEVEQLVGSTTGPDIESARQKLKEALMFSHRALVKCPENQERSSS